MSHGQISKFCPQFSIKKSTQKKGKIDENPLLWAQNACFSIASCFLKSWVCPGHGWLPWRHATCLHIDGICNSFFARYFHLSGFRHLHGIYCHSKPKQLELFWHPFGHHSGI